MTPAAVEADLVADASEVRVNHIQQFVSPDQVHPVRSLGPPEVLLVLRPLMVGEQ